MDGLYIKSVRIDETLPEGSYFSHIPSIVQLTNKELHFDKEVSLFVGENGSGKSTLLEALAVACGFNPEGGTKNFTFSTRTSHSDLHRYLTISRTAYPKDGFFFCSGMPCFPVLQLPLDAGEGLGLGRLMSPMIVTTSPGTVSTWLLPGRVLSPLSPPVPVMIMRLS